jgi:uncharacterized protein (UPF0335 family)
MSQLTQLTPELIERLDEIERERQQLNEIIKHLYQQLGRHHLLLVQQGVRLPETLREVHPLHLRNPQLGNVASINRGGWYSYQASLAGLVNRCISFDTLVSDPQLKEKQPLVKELETMARRLSAKISDMLDLFEPSSREIERLKKENEELKREMSAMRDTFRAEINGIFHYLETR